MCLAGLLSGAGIGWYSGILHMRIKQTDPKKVGISVDGDRAELSGHHAWPRFGGAFSCWFVITLVSVALQF
jgi:hypothetical protein